MRHDFDDSFNALGAHSLMQIIDLCSISKVMEEKETLEMCAKVSQKMKKKRRKIVNNFHPFPERFPSCCVPSANVCLL
jgi:hypothetical protein